MKNKLNPAFTMLELVFVIVVIGILSTVALPRFMATSNSAYITKTKSLVSTIRSAVITERQQRILAGDNTPINALNVGGGVFNTFNANAAGSNNPVVSAPIFACANAGAVDCWTVAGTNYTYRLPSPLASGVATVTFALAGNRFTCPLANNTPATCQVFGF